MNYGRGEDKRTWHQKSFTK